MLESAVADLEGAPAGVATSSGMAAILVALLALAPKPAPLVAPRDAYGTTLTLLRTELQPLGYEIRTADYRDLDAVRRSAKGAGLVIAETISNPLCRPAELRDLAQIAESAGAPLLVDNKFATPTWCRPLEDGATAVVHSATKFIGGHSDLVAGVVVGASDDMAQARARAIHLGTTLGPFEAWLALRGLRTLALRIDRQSANAVELALALSKHHAVERVHYPGFGAMMAIELRGGRAAVQRLLDRLRMVLFAASLGGIETTISPSALTSHRALSEAEREELGITPGLVRVSVGIEDAGDIVADFKHALS